MFLFISLRQRHLQMKNIIKDLSNRNHAKYLGGLDILKYIGPGLLVTVGFIDPGNWASNFAAGSSFGYSLLWIVTLSTIMLIILQHNVAHLGIVTGLCLSEAATKYTPHWVSRPILCTAILASISTSLAEILGGAIALQMLLDIPIVWGAILTTVFVSVMLFTNSYKKIERAIIAFVSVIGLSFIYELFLVKINWPIAVQSWVTPSFPRGSMLIIMSVLGAVVMPHNLFLHSEVIQSRQCNTQGDECIQRQLKYELFDTLFSMIVGWAINSAMILLAAATFFNVGEPVSELQQAKSMLEPLLGNNAAIIFALALLMAGISSTITSGMAAGSIFAGMFEESYHIKDSHSQVGVIISLGVALLLIFFIGNPFKGLIISQMVLSIQLPFTVFLQVSLTSSRKVMGQYANSTWNTILLYGIASIVTILNIMLFISAL
jgi:manganese transport protein